MVVAMLSVLLSGIGTAHAVIGVLDDVPGEDIVVPFICEKTGTLDTEWAIAELSGLGGFTDAIYFNVQSQFVKDEVIGYTPHDVFTDACKNFISGACDTGLITPACPLPPAAPVIPGRFSPIELAKLDTSVTENGTPDDVYAGYVIYINEFALDQYAGWIYLNDIPNGFNAGFDAYSVEEGVDLGAADDLTISPSELVEAGFHAPAPVGAPLAPNKFYPRYFFLNDNPATFNWWIILKGGAPGVTATGNPDHFLNCAVICDEEENCPSTTIPVPNNLNFVDVSQYLPFAVPPTGIGGFANCCTQTNSVGTCSGFINPATGDEVTSMGWAYQRAATGTVISNWDVAHPMHRCSVSFVGIPDDLGTCP